jgi:hypothetical protein
VTASTRKSGSGQLGVNDGADVKITAFAIVEAEIAPVVAATVAAAAVVTTYSLYQDFVEGEREG